MGKRLAYVFCFIIVGLVQSEAQARPFTVLALGDSLTQGYGLPPEDGFVPQLQEWLRVRDHDVNIINGGVSGDTSAGGAARIAWSLTPDVDAVIVSLGGNDVLRALPPTETRKNIEHILKTIATLELRMIVIALPAPGNYGARYQSEFDAIFPELAQRYNASYVSNFFRGLTLATQNGPSSLSSFMQKDGIHPNTQGVRLIVDDLGPAIERLLQED